MARPKSDTPQVAGKDFMVVSARVPMDVFKAADDVALSRRLRTNAQMVIDALTEYAKLNES